MTAPEPHRRDGAAVSPGRREAFRALVELSRGSRRETFRESDDGSDASSPDGGIRFAGLAPRERAWAERLFRGTLQRGLGFDRLLESLEIFRADRTPPPLAWALRTALYQRYFMEGVPDYAIVAQAVALARGAGGERGAGFVNAALRAAFRRGPASPADYEAWRRLAPPEARFSMPADLIELLRAGYGFAPDAPEFAALLDAFNVEESRVRLRPNTLRNTAEELVARLAEEGVPVELDERLGALRPSPDAESAAAPWRTRAWAEGRATVQDPGAMLAVRMAAPRPGERVADWCAAPGGKTGQLWEAMGGEGTLAALEPDDRRRAVLSETLSRLYGRDNAIRVGREEDLAEGEAFDLVLVDAPCLALGLVRRHPEIRWDDRWKGAARMAAGQTEILSRAARRVAPGGRLLWATCSPTLAENEGVVGAWLEREGRASGFSPVDPESAIPPEARDWTAVRGFATRTRPDLAPADAFCMTLVAREG